MLTPVKFGKIFQLAAPVKIGKNFQLAGAGVAYVRTGPTRRSFQLAAPTRAHLAAHIVVAPLGLYIGAVAHPGYPCTKKATLWTRKGGRGNFYQ